MHHAGNTVGTTCERRGPQAVASLEHPTANTQHPTRLGRNEANQAMETIKLYDAKTRFSQRVDKTASGEDGVVSRNGKPLVRITRLQEPQRRIKFGVMKGRLAVAADFDAALPVNVLAGFEGR